MACCICLATDVKLYNMCKYRLKTTYEILTGSKMSSNQHFEEVCAFCGTLLHKFSKFRDKCIQTQLILSQMHLENGLITTENINLTNSIKYPNYSKHLAQSVDIFAQTEIKEEVDFDIKSDTYDQLTDFDEINIPTEFLIKNDLDNESDEEPLSNIVKKKKRKKVKSENFLEQKKVLFDDDMELVILSKEEQMKEVELRKMSVNYLNSMYKCDICFKGFKSDSTYKNHMGQHDVSAGPIVCDICHMRRPNMRAMKAHTLITHERRYTCRICSASCKTAQRAREHSAWHTGLTYNCHCGAHFHRSTSYLTHIRLHHPTSHACEQCGESFIGELGLKLHKKKAHKYENKNQNLKEYHILCKSCGFKFKNKEALLKHTQLSEGNCDHTLSVCDECGENFLNKNDLNEHLKIHEKNNSIRTCNECLRTFANEHSLVSHYSRAHAHVRKLVTHCVCEVCGHTCHSKSALTNHQRTHTGEKPYQCTLCHKTFSVYQRLQIHIRTHTGERPFKCTNCTKAFKHKAALNRHNRVHTGIKPYSCPQCGKCFSQSNSMKQHCAGVHMKQYIYPRRSNKHA